MPANPAASSTRRPISRIRTRPSRARRPCAKSSDHFFFRLSDPACVEFLQRMDADARTTAARGRQQGAGVAGRRAPAKARASPTGTSRATRRTSASRFPDAPGKYFYVWLDAPVGYLASLKAHLDGRRASTSPRSCRADDVDQYHFIGKDIVYFHTLFWPAMLKFAGAPYKVPDNVFVHGFITASGEKMSKSRGTGVSPDVYLDLGLNPEWLRYYIAAKLNAKVEDIDFNPDDFIARVNSDLIGKYVNIASRAATFITRYFDGKLSPPRPTTDDRAERAASTMVAWGSRRRDRGSLRGARVRQGAARGDAHRRPHQRALRPGEAVGARQGSGAPRRAAGRLHATRSMRFAC